MEPSAKTHFTFSPCSSPATSLVVTDIQTLEETLQVPLEEEGKSISGLLLPPDRILSSVKTLILPKHLEVFEATSRNFPSLQRLFRGPKDSPEKWEEAADLAVYRSQMKTDISLLLRQLPYRREVYELLACLSSQKRFVIPQSVIGLGPFAFRDSPVEEILCESTELENVNPQAFQGSAWIEKNCLLTSKRRIVYLARETKELIVPENVTGANNWVFKDHVPQKLSLPTMKVLERLGYAYDHLDWDFALPEVYVRNTQNFLACARNCPTESFSFPEENAEFTCVDGVVFSKDKSTLLLYPKWKRDREYSVPEGTKAIGESAFYRTKFLQKLCLPSTMTSLEQNCFQEMVDLQEVYLHDGIEVIPKTLFALNQKLRSVSFPKSLRTIEIFAFLGTALEEVTLPEGVLSIGQGAFMDNPLKRVHLPSTLQFLEESSIQEVKEVWAYEGTAKGLYSAAYDPPRRRFFHDFEKEPSGLIHVLGGAKERILFFPRELLPPEFEFSQIWDGDVVDYELIQRIFSHLTSFEEKIRLALSLALQEEDPRGEYHQYLRRRSKRAGEYFLSFESETPFRLFVKEISLSPGTREALLNLCNQKGLVEQAAYLLDQKGRQTSPRGFSL